MNDETPVMTSHRPYLLRALYEWIADNDMTPHLLVDATRSGVQVPLHAVSEGRIVLNVAQQAVSGLEMSNELIRFSARFGGVSQSISVPTHAVVAIYARETGQGMVLPDETGDEADAGQNAHPSSEGAATQRPALSAVPSDASGAERIHSDAEDNDDDPAPDGDGTDPSGPRRGGHLRVVK
ncbi:ClpXP protease specificity-enhancing factor [Lysobacter ciconiae]|uniref:ClpXP protease specificity-enhancing factor n=1 Tax=Novilysobacter ciconiae TaxID=2781022 RepID=A0A7S6ZT41_9GAMM|nr:MULTISPECIES: ClpXP protease specificity-enhancing factor [Lysobacter]QOW20299.1 ClpXP protease specificity-enhancing factor [Lysobacter ciconiae]QOY63503.1 ClpXP protease specificity-enhancing factor [Lysobacter sp. H21R4]